MSALFALLLLISFDDAVGYSFGNFDISGVTFSPACPVWRGRGYLQTDPENSCLGHHNPVFPGVGDGSVWITTGGQFDFLGLTAVSPSGFMTTEIRSSHGDLITYNGVGPLVVDIRGVDWIMLTDTWQSSFHDHHGWDDMKFDWRQVDAVVSEPGMVGLIVLMIVLTYLLVSTGSRYG